MIFESSKNLAPKALLLPSVSNCNWCDISYFPTDFITHWPCCDFLMIVQTVSCLIYLTRVIRQAWWLQQFGQFGAKYVAAFGNIYVDFGVRSRYLRRGLETASTLFSMGGNYLYMPEIPASGANVLIYGHTVKLRYYIAVFGCVFFFFLFVRH